MRVYASLPCFALWTSLLLLKSTHALPSPNPLLDLEDPILPSRLALDVNGQHILHNQQNDDGSNVKPDHAHRPKKSPNANIRVLGRAARRSSGLGSMSPPPTAAAYAQPAKVPMPLLKPREVDNQLGDRDEDLEDRTKCGEAAMHDCYVSHESERVKERRAEASPLALERSPSARSTKKNKMTLVRRR